MSDYFRIVDPGVEEEAEELESSTADKSNLEAQRAVEIFKLKAVAKVLNPVGKYFEDVELVYSSTGVGSYLNTKDQILAEGGDIWSNIFGDDKYDEDWNAIAAFAQGDEALASGLDYLPEGHVKADEWNKALRKF